MSPKFVIKSKAGYVTGFSEEHQIVQVTDKATDAERFTAKDADGFMAFYADAGYGLKQQGTIYIPEDEAQDIPAKKVATEEDSAKTAEVIDLTPTWSAVVPVLIMALETGTEKGKDAAKKELAHMARVADAHVAEHRPIPEGEGYSLTVKVQRNKVTSDAVVLHVGRVRGADDHAAELALKAASMVDGMFHFEAHLEHDEGADGYDAPGNEAVVGEWECDGR